MLGVWKGVKVARGVDPISHMQFVDDTFLTGGASEREARLMKKTLEIYGKVSGQKINWAKSEIFFFNTPYNKRIAIGRVLNIKQGCLPSRYLGIPLFQGRNTSEVWKGLAEKCLRKMEGWKGKWLSSARRILMLKSVVSTVPIFSMMCLKIPKKVINSVEKKMRKFFWSGAGKDKKWPLLKWEKICKHKKFGGVGIRDWNIMNIALGAKMVWQMANEGDQLWIKILKAKYLDSNDNIRILTIQNPIRGSSIWNFILSCRHVITDHVSWVIGDGKRAKFWEDSWNGYKSIEEEGVDKELRQKLCDLWGKNVKDYVVEKEGIFGKEWV